MIFVTCFMDFCSYHAPQNGSYPSAPSPSHDHEGHSSSQLILKLWAQFSFFKSVPVPSYAWSRRRRIIPGLGTRTSRYPFVLYNHAALTHKTMMQLLIFFFSFDLNKKAKRSDRQVRSKSHVVNDFIVRFKSSMEVSSKTPD